MYFIYLYIFQKSINFKLFKLLIKYEVQHGNYLNSLIQKKFKFIYF